ncbi:MAG: tetratricopeptide repeat protein [Bryobacteraceae bacterium]|jgi:tetratricopeptide (TPR) repeat protein
MRRTILGPALTALALLAAAAEPAWLGAQEPVKAPAPARTAKPHAVPPLTDDGTKLAENGHCEEAFPLLKRAFARVTVHEQRKHIGLNLVKCALETDAVDEATATLRTLNREFTNDPDVLFLSVHIYSELSLRAGRALMRTAPGSPQVHELNAEALESQGKWDDAAKEYRLVLERFPEYPGMHFKLGRLMLTRPDQPVNFSAARSEFEAELKLNPDNAAAECVLGEMSRQEAKWPDAIEHFTRATKLDASLFDAFLGHGRALLSAGRAAEAIPPLERAVQLQSQNPMAHLQLGNAYQQSGRKDDAAREFAALKQTSEQLKQATDKVKAGLDGVNPNQPPR